MIHDDVHVGEKFGRLEVEREIGTGAFGRVYLAKDPLIARVVALKVLRGPPGAAPAAEDRANFLAEARTIGGFSHPNIVTLFQAHEVAGGGFVLEMEYVDGGTLEDLLGEDERLPVSRALAVARDVASALAAAHAAGVVHGDVKAGNVLLTKDGRVKLADFGLARLLGAREPAAGRMGIAGTPYYMAPEVIQGEAFLPASDVWSLGVLLHRMLSGRLPFARNDLHTLFVSIQNEPAPALGPETPPEAARVVERCLEKRASDRFADGAALFDALARREPSREGEVPRARVPVALARLVGRAAEGSRLAAALERLRGGAGNVVVATGPAGIGKSALMLAAVEEARRQGLRAVTAAVSPVEGLVRPLFRAIEEIPAPLEILAEAGLPGLSREPDFTAVERRLASLATARPVAVLLEDLHHATPEEVRGLVRLCRRLSRSPVLWLVSERTSDLGPASSASSRSAPLLEVEGVERLDVGPLPGEAVSRLLEESAEGGRLSGAVLDRLVHRSAGNPFFALQWFRHLRETGAVAREGAEWVLHDPAAAAAPPPALNDLVSRRLLGLPENARALLDVAAVDGFEFDGEALAAVLKRPLLSVLRSLQTLCRVQGLVAPRERGYRFAHPLLHEVLYGEVSPDLRRELHRRLAEHLEARGEGVDPERLGTHWERAGDAVRAAPRLLQAAQSAARRQENLRAVDLARRAGVTPGEIQPEFARRNALVLLSLGSCYADLGRTSDCERIHAAVIRGAGEAGDDLLRFRSLVSRAHARYLGPGLAEGDEADVRSAAERLPPGPELGRARYLLGLLEKYRGNLVVAERWLKGADDLFVAAKDVAWHGSALDQLASVAVRSGRVEEGERLYADAARVCRLVGRNVNGAISGINGALAAVSRGRLDGQDERIKDAAALLATDGATNFAANARALLAEILYFLGDVKAARETLDASIEAMRRSGFQTGLVTAGRLDVELRTAAGDFAGAKRALDELRERVERQGDRENETLAGANEACLLLALGRGEDGEAKARAVLGQAATGCEPRARAETAATLVPGAFLGLSAAALEAVRSFAAGAAGEVESPYAVQVRRTLDAAVAWARPAAPSDDLMAGARTLLGDSVAGRRSLWRIAGRLFEGEARRRSADPAAVDSFRKALEASRALSHALLEMECLRRLRVVDGEGPWSSLLGKRVREIARGLDSPSAASFRAFWTRDAV